jgi:hypothetical protein
MRNKQIATNELFKSFKKPAIALAELPKEFKVETMKVIGGERINTPDKLQHEVDLYKNLWQFQRNENEKLKAELAEQRNPGNLRTSIKTALAEKCYGDVRGLSTEEATNLRSQLEKRAIMENQIDKNGNKISRND